MSNLQNITEQTPQLAASNTLIKGWRERFAAPLMVSALIVGLFVLTSAFLATDNIATKIFYVVAYLFLLAITVFPFAYNTRIIVFLVSVFAMGINELISYGILGDGLIFFFGTVVVATMMFSPRAGIITLSGTVLTFFGMGYAI